MRIRINLIALIIVLLLIGIVGFWARHFWPVFVERWQEIQTELEKYAPAPRQEELLVTESLEIKLPETAEELTLKEELKEEPGPEEEPVIAEKPEQKPKLSLSEIEGQIEEISAKIENISQEVTELVEASGKEPIVSEGPAAPVGGPAATEAELLAAIEGQVNDISAQVEIVSQQVAELAEAST